MEEEQILADGETSETEDIVLSASEEVDVPLGTSGLAVSIDYNSRVMTGKVNCDDFENQDCDTNFVDNFSHLKYHKKSENELATSTEDLDVSDEEEPSCSNVVLQYGSSLVACSKKNGDSFSTLNYSSSCYKDEYATDAECISEDEGQCNTEERSEGGFSRKLSSGLSIVDDSSIKSCVKLPNQQKPLSSLNIKNVFTNSLFIDDRDLIDLQEEQETPLMTCLEFLKSEISDDNNTDAEDVSIGSLSENDEIFGLRNRYPSEKKFRLPGDAVTCSSKNNQENKISYSGDSRRSSIIEFLTDEETICLDNSVNRGRKRPKKYAVKFDERSDDSFTDEELLDMKDKG